MLLHVSELTLEKTKKICRKQIFDTSLYMILYRNTQEKELVMSWILSAFISLSRHWSKRKFPHILLQNVTRIDSTRIKFETQHPVLCTSCLTA